MAGGGGISFGRAELRDIGAAWVALSVAFALFFLTTSGRVAVGTPTALFEMLGTELFARIAALCFVTAGVGFLLHELAHKVVAVRFGQVARFKADYTMLGLAVFAGAVGFIFAAPGAVYHTGRITERQNGLIAVAGPVTNVVLGLAFVPVWFAGGGLFADAGQLGVAINFLLAGFNMIPFGPLDGRKVLDWSVVVFAVAFVICVGLGVWGLFYVGFPY